jgi:N,N'-diacetyllegionaminate synthase
MNEIKTKFSIIGDKHPCYIIAEIGSNHNGSYDIACELIEKAVESGVDAVKFQTFKAATHYSKRTKRISLYDEDIYSLIEKLEVDRSWHKRLDKFCIERKIDFLDSPCDFEAIDIAVSINMPLMKVASFDMVDSRLIDKITKTGKGIIFSAGMASMREIENVVNISRNNNNESIAILQCTSLYPAPVNLTNLNSMATIKKAFDVIVGYSDHTLGDHISCAAVAVGAKIIEKHYTLKKNMDGPDHAFAIEPDGLKDMVNRIRDIEAALGDGIKNGPRAEEMEFYKNARRSLIAKIQIKAGSKIREEDIIIKRPNYGIHPEHLNIVVGMIAKIDIEKDEPITWEKLK